MIGATDTRTEDRSITPWTRRWPSQLLPIPSLVVTFLCIGVGDAAGAIIPVTTLQQKISASGGCSLQEAIFSANLDNNVAISGYQGSTPIEVVTQCVPGSGDDIIVLPAGAVLSMSRIVDDHINPTGPTATPIITSNITILGYGATLRRTGSSKFRLFAVGSTGHLTIRRAYIADFWTQGGNGGHGAGGGMGAGGAIYVMGGGLVVEASTFAGNAATGGTGGVGISGGGGGLGGAGGPGFCTFDGDAGGGGGGARGAGSQCFGIRGGGGGGTLRAALYGDGGFACGGDGGYDSGTGLTGDGQSGQCAGGGGGGGGALVLGLVGHDGGSGSYGGGGGGGDLPGGGTGGRGGFGGGGGASGVGLFFGADGGNGGFGGGGGAGNDGEIADGNSGDGGFFAGDGGSVGGGGGAGLGGAIFSDGGSVVITNSTFSSNVSNGGYSEKAQDGSGGGGAIFSRNGHLTVLNATISGNLARFGGGIVVAQVSENAPTSFVLENSIIANNGETECAITGFSIGAAFAGNLIQNNVADGTEFQDETFIGCQGVVATSDPQLGPLQYDQGATPTMAIASNSPAWNAADPASSLPVDQRRQPRPEMGGFDIGAFEFCVEGFGRLAQPCIILAGIEDPGGSDRVVELTMQVHPAGSGTTVPASGTRNVAQDTVVALKATPNPGYRFTEWSANVTQPGEPSTTVVMSASQLVTANFAACKCATDVTSSVGIAYGALVNAKPERYEQIVTLTNNSAATIAGPISLVLDNLDANVTVLSAAGETELMLPAGSPYVNAKTNLAPGQSVTMQLRFRDPVDDVVTYTARVLAGKGSR